METPLGASLLFLYGNDELAISRRLAELQARHDRDGMNTARLEARTCSLEDLNNALYAMPFLSAMRLVFLANPSARSPLPAERQKLLRLLLAAPPTTQVVLHEKVERNEIKDHWLLKRAGKGELKAEPCLMPGRDEMPGWISRETTRQKGKIDPAAASLLAEMVGEETRVAAQEITKLLTYANYARPITVADVEAVSIVSAQGDIFALVDAIGKGEGKLAQKTLHRLLENEDAMALWGMVIRQFRLLLQAKELLDSRGTPESVSQALHLHPYVSQKICAQAKRFSLPALEKIHHRLLEMDEGAKTSQVPLDLALDVLIVELTR